MSIVDRIKELCTAKGTDITNLERDLGLGKSTISKWKNSSPKSDSLQKIADYFHVTTDYLLGREETKTNPKIRTIAAHLEDKEITDKKMDMIMQYLNALFDEEEKNIKKEKNKNN